MAATNDTIVAVSTPPGRGAVGIVRLSGSASAELLHQLTGKLSAPREVRYTAFRDDDGSIIDHGLVFRFVAPASYTGEDMVECHAHGNPLLLDGLQRRLVQLGARPARPGEFTERAFLNGKLDLAQAEAVADLIASQSVRAARAAQRTLSGAFGEAVRSIITQARAAHAELEASIDFADDVHAAALIEAQRARLADIVAAMDVLRTRAARGRRLLAGAALAIVGAPNVGKSSLLNALAETERAIVAPVAGTTRDTIDVDLLIGGVPVSVVDTAGLRDTADIIERAGIERALTAVAQADLVLLVCDRHRADNAVMQWHRLETGTDMPPDVILVHNKIDLDGYAAGVIADSATTTVGVSAVTGAGIDTLKATLVECLGVSEGAATEFGVQARHLDALERARAELGAIDAASLDDAPELAAEHYRQASHALEAISGRYSTEDLLGEIFARFCIGK